MTKKEIDRREFLKRVLGGVAMVSLDWGAFPKAFPRSRFENEFDAIIIGSGLGGLSCAAAFARQGFRPLVIEQHYKAGGYATTFSRPGGFEFDVSLHSTTVGEREGIRNLIPGFPEIKDVNFEPHPSLYRAIYPGYDITVPQKNPGKFIAKLIELFPEEKDGIYGIFEDMKGVNTDINKYSSLHGNIDMNNFQNEFPYLFKSFNKTWGDLVNSRIHEPKLKAIVSSLWIYYGLPPSKLSPYYYAMPTWGYLKSGGYYPKGKSQKISDTFKEYITEKGGKVLLNTKAEKILVKNNKAYGVLVSGGREYTARVIISNASVPNTFSGMLDDKSLLFDYNEKLKKYSVSLSSFQVFLGLKEDLIEKTGITDSEIFYSPSFDMDAGYESMKKADMENTGYGITLYDNIYKGYSPDGKNTINIIVLQGFDYWEKYKEDYFDYNKKAYNKEKERMAEVLIKKVEETLLPGLRKSIEIMEIGTPLTNIRYTGNYNGAIYGFDQTLDNSGQSRLEHTTPVNNLYLAGAWTAPGHGYGGVIYSGLQCFSKIMEKW